MKKKLTIVGIGPGSSAYLCPAAHLAITQATDLVGYGLYLDLLGTLTENKTCHTRTLGQETERAKLALSLASSGLNTTLISSGDAGIFAMASLVFELLDQQPQPEWHAIHIEVVPGISAMQAAASRCGAPLGHDFCVISLSDLLTPWDTIETRLHAAGTGDFVVALYNPVSQRRHWQLARAREILLHSKTPTTPTIIARNLTRADESIHITTLGDLTVKEVDMLTIVLIGNNETRRVGQWVYTPRGYSKNKS